MKKGLSEIVTAVLLILIALAAIVLVWAFVKPVIQQSSEKISAAQAAQNALSIQGRSITVGSDGSSLLTLIVQRNPGTGNITGFTIVLEDNTGKSVGFVYPNVTLTEYESVRIPIYYGNKSLGNITRISIVPFVNSNGRSVLAPAPSDSYTLSGSEPRTSNVSFIAGAGNHTVCNNNMCTVVSGSGTSQCAMNSDCTLSTGNNWCNGADFNHDGSVTISEYIDLSSKFGTTSCTAGNSWCQGSDLNHDGSVSISDFIDFNSNFGRTDCRA
ncbi:hypothetical protein KW787_02810 [Candidatus Pacearchaeota archaeon]|nr:hypothetical protein [Candidatus Pacearchaeota archaeon]